MNENQELRKEKARDFLKEAYSPIERKWYQTKSPTYELVTAGLQSNRKHFLKDEEIIIKNDLRQALYLSAFFVLLSIGIFLFQKGNQFEHFFMIGIWIIILLVNGLDRRAKIILNSKSIWCNGFDEAILWEKIIAIYYKKEENGDSKHYSLMIHFYYERYDYFKEIEFKLNYYKQTNEEIITAIKDFC